ncbi:MAG: hypothetical protein ACTHOL_00595, partial [Luteibacter jiangsuensis]
ENGFLLAPGPLQVTHMHTNLVGQHVFLLYPALGLCCRPFCLWGRALLARLSDNGQELPLVFRCVDLDIAEDGAVGQCDLPQCEVTTPTAAGSIQRLFQVHDIPLSESFERLGECHSHGLGNQPRTVPFDHLESADKEAGTDHTKEVRRHTKADVESSGTMQKKGLWHEGDTSNDTFLKAVSGYR